MVNSLSIFSKGISGRVPFIVPAAGVIAGSNEFSFLQLMHGQNCCHEPLGVCFLTTIIELTHGDMILWIIPALSMFLISYFRKSWCLSARGRGGLQLELCLGWWQYAFLLSPSSYVIIVF